MFSLWLGGFPPQSKLVCLVNSLSVTLTKAPDYIWSWFPGTVQWPPTAPQGPFTCRVSLRGTEHGCV